MYKLFLAYRYLCKRRIAYFAVLAVALCVAMVLVVHSVMNGFVDTVRNSSRNLLGDIIIEIGGTESFPFYDDFIGEVRSEFKEAVTAATPVVMNYGLMKIMDPEGIDRDRNIPVLVNGIRLEEYRRINSFSRGLYYDKHFPGTTSLAKAKHPTYYLDSNGNAKLPDEYDAALKKYAEQNPNDAEAQAYLKPGLGKYSGPGNFAARSVNLKKNDSEQYRGRAYPGLIIGVEMVGKRLPNGEYERWYPKGTLTRLVLLSLTPEGNTTADLTTTVAMRYVDDSRTRIFEIDSQTVYCNFDYLQKQINLGETELVDGGVAPARASQIQIKLAEGVDFNESRQRIEELWKAFLIKKSRYLDRRDFNMMSLAHIKTWEQRNIDFINAVEKERILVLILFGMISMVAVVLVGCIFYMIVQEKTRDIGLIKSIGATSGGVGQIFLVYACGVGIVGSLLGCTIGTLFVIYINEIQDLLASLDPSLRVWSPETYSFDRIPSTVQPFDAFMIVIVAIVASMLGSIIAARRAARVWPIDALRYE